MDAAFHRYLSMKQLVEREYRSASADPLKHRNRELGLIAPGLNRQAAEAALKALFSGMQEQLHRQTLLELCAVFEEAFRAAFPNILGRARAALRKELADRKAVRTDMLVRDLHSFQGLDSIFDLLSVAGSPQAKALNAIRVARNSIAHGRHLGPLPEIAEVHAQLRAVLDAAL